MTLLDIGLLLVILALSIGLIAIGQQQNRLEQRFEELKTVVASNRRAVRFEQSVIDSKQSAVSNLQFNPNWNATATGTYVSPYYMPANSSSPDVIDELSRDEE